LQKWHFPQAELIHAIPTRSPKINLFAPEPSLSTLPTIWCPKTIGSLGGSLPSISSSSVWQIPQAEILTKIWLSPGTGSGKSSIFSGFSSIGEVSLSTMAFIS
jgi:hypothetical protein